MKLLIKGFVILFLLAGVPTAYILGHMHGQENQPALSTPKVVYSSGIKENQIFDLINKYRSSKNRDLLKTSKKLCLIASERLHEVKSNFSHDGYMDLDSSVAQLGYYHRGENLAKDYWTNEDVVDAWTRSASHEANMVRPTYTDLCVRTDGNNVVAIFGGN